MDDKYKLPTFKIVEILMKDDIHLIEKFGMLELAKLTIIQLDNDEES